MVVRMIIRCHGLSKNMDMRKADGIYIVLTSAQKVQRGRGSDTVSNLCFLYAGISRAKNLLNL